MSARVVVAVHLTDSELGETQPFPHDGRTIVALKLTTDLGSDVCVYVDTVEQANALLVLANEVRDALVRARDAEGPGPSSPETGDEQ